MITIVDKLQIIRLKEEGNSNREVARRMGIDRKTVSRYWKKYEQDKLELGKANININEVQERIVAPPKYKVGNRNRVKYTQEIEDELQRILKLEVKKDKILGPHKQQLTKKQIYEKLKKEGFDISYCTVNIEINRLRKKAAECFIRQHYDLGDRLEYDFGEVKLNIDGKTRTYHMAVISSPGGEFRWAYLYNNQKKEVFLDSHVEFFEMVKGTYKEVVYDNMRNVVSKFIGKNTRELNEDLIKLSIYYGFKINVTNCFKPNEKGYVESSVRILRNKIFATTYKFNALSEARQYLKSQLLKLNEDSKIQEEKKHLLPYLPKLELATISENDVNKYSFVRVSNNSYSVPDYLVGKKVTVKSYYNKICIYSNNTLVCKHNKPDGEGRLVVEISHYLKTLYKKPGAVRNSLVLKSIPELKKIYDTYYSDNPRKFIKIFIDNQNKSILEMVEIFKSSIEIPSYIKAIEVLGDSSFIASKTREQLSTYNTLCVGKDVQHGII